MVSVLHLHWHVGVKIYRSQDYCCSRLCSFYKGQFSKLANASAYELALSYWICNCLNKLLLLPRFSRLRKKSGVENKSNKKCPCYLHGHFLFDLGKAWSLGSHPKSYLIGSRMMASMAYGAFTCVVVASTGTLVTAGGVPPGGAPTVT